MRIGLIGVMRAMAALLAAAATPVAAQCTPQWSAGEGVSGVNGRVDAVIAWDPDGAGPQPATLVVGGEFTSAGGVPFTNRIARWDGTTWVPLGTGMSGGGLPAVFALAVLPNGDLVAGGGFINAGGVLGTSNIARWNGSAWAPLGTGTGAVVYALAVLPNGDLVAGGEFATTRWNGSTWAPLGAGAMDGAVYALAALPNGDLFAGGSFTILGGVPANGITHWNGSTWAAMGTGVGGGFPAVTSLAALATGEAFAGGYFTAAGGVAGTSRIAFWSGSGWAPLGSGMNSTVSALALLPNGDLVAGGYFTTAGGVPANRIARWNGSAWAPLGTGVSGVSGGPTPQVAAMAVLANGDLAATGEFTTAGSAAVSRIARWGCPPPPPCYPNCDQSTTPPIINVLDFACFLNKFAAGDPYANCDHSTTPPALNIQDFACFLNSFAAGCS